MWIHTTPSLVMLALWKLRCVVMGYRLIEMVMHAARSVWILLVIS